MYQNVRDYSPVVLALQPVLDNLPGKVIAIGGGLGAGKTTLGRYLAYSFNISLVETDLFRLPNQAGRITYRNDILADVIARRVDRQSPRPVIIEGAVVLRLLAELRRTPDFYIHISSAEEGDVIDSEECQDVERYRAEYSPSQRADLVLDYP